MISEYRRNKGLIHAYLRGDPIEGFKASNVIISGLPLIIFVTLLIVELMLWIIAWVALLKYWNDLSGAGKFFALLFCLVGLGPLALIVIYVGKKEHAAAVRNSFGYRFF